jgi:predicted transcriptional regulator
MLPDLREIKSKRLNAGLTQSQLASQSGVSQSLIAKIEAGSIEPSYGRAKKLFDCLNQLHAKQEKTAKELMTGPVAFVEGDDSLKKAIKALERHGFSQLPVLSKGKPVGSISEKSILAKINSEKVDIEKAKAEDAMEEALPSIQPQTPESVVRQLLAFSPAVLVVKKGRIAGIITKSDLLKQMIK